MFGYLFQEIENNPPLVERQPACPQTRHKNVSHLYFNDYHSSLTDHFYDPVNSHQEAVRHKRLLVAIVKTQTTLLLFRHRTKVWFFHEFWCDLPGRVNHNVCACNFQVHSLLDICGLKQTWEKTKRKLFSSSVYCRVQSFVDPFFFFFIKNPKHDSVVSASEKGGVCIVETNNSALRLAYYPCFCNTKYKCWNCQLNFNWKKKKNYSCA